MIGYIRLLFIASLIFLSQVEGLAQIPEISPMQAQEELEKRGISEEEVKARMKEKGYDLDNIDPADTAEVAEVQKALEETIAELEAEKKDKDNQNTMPSTPTDQSPDTSPSKDGEEVIEAVDNIEEAVKEGESLENALAKEFTELVQIDLPPSKIWGQHLFRDKSLKLFTRSEDATPPDTYVLGVGDQINISIWGMSQADFNLEIRKDGYIYPSNMPRIYLKIDS